MLGPGWYGGSGGAASVNRAGSTGQKLHGPGHASPSYYSGSWSGHPQKLNYSWQLQDVGPQDGGFVLVPVREGSPFAHCLLCFHGPGHSNHNAAGWSCRFPALRGEFTRQRTCLFGAGEPQDVVPSALVFPPRDRAAGRQASHLTRRRRRHLSVTQKRGSFHFQNLEI